MVTEMKLCCHKPRLANNHQELEGAKKNSSKRALEKALLTPFSNLWDSEIIHF